MSQLHCFFVKLELIPSFVVAFESRGLCEDPRYASNCQIEVIEPNL